MSLSFKDVSEILKIIDESDIAELVLEVGDTKIVVRRDSAGKAALETPTTAGAPTPEPKPAPAPAPESEPAPPAVTADDVVPEGMTAIRAPMVGTFYRKPGPQDPPYAEVGDRVAVGDPLCLIEVMKLFTTIESPVDGRIAEIRAENEDLVQIEQLLFVIEPG
ncbi:MAG: acetyl-CoA carboxylase biotin carboxyl carrier protein [Alphaproteobacteria bacterium]|nr:acetyl-CoA carboxylase biotin carboxyl carrier protein [Alphaproteobacteria bacterium]